MMRNGRPAERRVIALDLIMMRLRFSDSQVFGRFWRAGSGDLKQRVQRVMKEGETAEKAPRCRMLASWERRSSPPVSKSRWVKIEVGVVVYGAVLRIVPSNVLFGGLVIFHDVDLGGRPRLLHCPPAIAHNCLCIYIFVLLFARHLRDMSLRTLFT